MVNVSSALTVQINKIIITRMADGNCNGNLGYVNYLLNTVNRDQDFSGTACVRVCFCATSRPYAGRIASYRPGAFRRAFRKRITRQRWPEIGNILRTPPAVARPARPTGA